MHPLPDRSTDLRSPAGKTDPLAPAIGPDAQMTVEVTPDGTVVVSGEIDSVTAPQLHRSLLAALHAHPEGVTLDLAAVTFCDCAGLRAFLTARASWAARAAWAAWASWAAPRRPDGGGDSLAPLTPLALGPVSPRMTRLLQLTGTGELFSPPKTGRPQ
ncbi:MULTISPECIES: STAS domain-containing protein [unclassified Streptomyces]|uniref:STAS domain-containing protein n=1 Tax=unclassified Streptomyces TaxID=2593676 RepID=UPI00296632E9|nr:STAS domain-containing protein [Streptomyces sp. SJL17-1]